MKNSTGMAIIELLILAVTISSIAAGLDYLRLSNGENPLFCLKNYDDTTKIEKYTSLLYTAERKVRNNDSEPLYNSKNIKYDLFGMISIKMPDKFLDSELDNKIVLIETENCNNQSKLYYNDENIKVYTFCLDEIEIVSDDNKITLHQKLEKDSVKTITELKNKLLLSKYNTNDSTIYELNTKIISTNGIQLIQCERDNIKDIYIGTKTMTWQPDFCTYKENN